jgi:hypothetical protein
MTYKQDKETDAPFDALSGTAQRRGSRISRTVAALMRAQMGQEQALKLTAAGWTSGKLKQQNDGALKQLELSTISIKALRKGGRAAIPRGSLFQVLWANRFACCVCRDPSRLIQVHHIVGWAESHDHRPQNLAVLCTEHHARAESKGRMNQNLTPQLLREYKQKWEADVQLLDFRAIMDAAPVDDSSWLYFNTLRLTELARSVGVDFKQLRQYRTALRAGLISASGEVASGDSDTPYRYAGRSGEVLYRYMKEVLEAALRGLPVRNISDDLDRSLLQPAIRAGDIVFVEGRHSFKNQSERTKGPGQAAMVRRSANHVEIVFSIDVWEGTSNSAWSLWLRGPQRVGSIILVRSVDKTNGKLLIQGTGLAIGQGLKSLLARSYQGDFEPNRHADVGDDFEDWTDASEPD